MNLSPIAHERGPFPVSASDENINSLTRGDYEWGTQLYTRPRVTSAYGEGAFPDFLPSPGAFDRETGQGANANAGISHGIITARRFDSFLIVIKQPAQRP
jgi:hypothetical protein